jgi:hypothetical protein
MSKAEVVKKVLSKDDVIKNVYYEPSGFSSRKITLEAARKRDKTITKEDVDNFMLKNTDRKKQLRGYNSFIAPYPKYEYQLDLFFINDLPKQTSKIGLVLIDIFTKQAVVYPLKGKDLDDILTPLLEGMVALGGRPEIIYSDHEGALGSNAMAEWFASQKNLTHHITRNHAHFAERFIRTFKDALYKRIDQGSAQNPQWTDFIFEIMLTYNNKNKHSATGMTPAEAAKPKNEIAVKMNLLLKKRHDRIYPMLSLGDKVKMFRKKEKGEKERTAVWSDEHYIVENISKEHGQNYYTLSGQKTTYLRNEMLKV